MADTATERVALFSIRPQYATALMSGEKRVEFRRQPLPDDVVRVVVYATAPVQRVIGSFEVDGVEALAPESAWAKYGEVGGIEENAFFRYYEGTGSAYVIRAGQATRAVTPFALSEISQSMRPPQSFMYLRDEALGRAHRLLGEQKAPSRTLPVIGWVRDRLVGAVAVG